MKTILIILLFFIPLPCSAEIVQHGTPIEIATKAFKSASYKEGALEMLSMNPDNRLMFWTIDRGTLIITYSVKSMKIIDLNYHLCDERPKAIRKNFEFDVKSFNTDSGELVIMTN